jgi:hypothetical protein
MKKNGLTVEGERYSAAYCRNCVWRINSPTLEFLEFETQAIQHAIDTGHTAVRSYTSLYEYTRGPAATEVKQEEAKNQLVLRAAGLLEPGVVYRAKDLPKKWGLAVETSRWLRSVMEQRGILKSTAGGFMKA